MRYVVALCVFLASLASGFAQQAGTVANMPFAGQPLNGSELLYIVQSGISKKTTVSQLIGSSVLSLNNIWTGTNTWTAVCNVFSDLSAGGATDLCAGSSQTTGFALPIAHPSTNYNFISKAPIPVNGTNTSDAYADWSLLNYLSGPHSDGVNHYGYFFDTMAQGSGAQNPNADIGMGCNIIKQGYGTAVQSATGTGEIDCLYVIARGVGPNDGSGNSPVGGLLVSAANVTGNGVQEWEGNTEEVHPDYNYLTPVYSIDTQIGTLAHYGAFNIGEGFIANSIVGANNDAFLAQNNGATGTWLYALSAVDACGSSGYYPLHITLDGLYELSSCTGGITQPYWLMGNTNGIWTLASGATSTLMMTVDQTGNAIVYGNFTVLTMPTTAASGLYSVCINNLGQFVTKTSPGSCS